MNCSQPLTTSSTVPQPNNNNKNGYYSFCLSRRYKALHTRKTTTSTGGYEYRRWSWGLLFRMNLLLKDFYIPRYIRVPIVKKMRSLHTVLVTYLFYSNYIYYLLYLRTVLYTTIILVVHYLLIRTSTACCVTSIEGGKKIQKRSEDFDSMDATNSELFWNLRRSTILFSSKYILK